MVADTAGDLRCVMIDQILEADFNTCTPGQQARSAIWAAVPEVMAYKNARIGPQGPPDRASAWAAWPASGVVHVIPRMRCRSEPQAAG